ncbi:hypothetical protein QR77_25355 [Streptomyces sp. 150FB]|uniref:DUF3017 domain-containing protein n=1 Tax=Streptomyces sp. 150FB TaxID=1576605 RepID=UPI000589443F|nr:DUF3017 domain-containing protein [Streptomyces sp. 150FB]KIF76314.1 hypothetical protein QR77_25355 [Streptomyces sp. 150FB]
MGAGTSAGDAGAQDAPNVSDASAVSAVSPVSPAPAVTAAMSGDAAPAPASGPAGGAGPFPAGGIDPVVEPEAGTVADPGDGAGIGAAPGIDDSDRIDADPEVVTQSTARPEGGGRAAASDASAPARQWPLLSVGGLTALGLVIVGLHPFSEAFRIGTIMVGIALIGAAVLRRMVPSVGMLAVRSRFTDMITYGLLGLLIVMLSLMTQPRPWLEIPFLEDIVHSTVP